MASIFALIAPIFVLSFLSCAFYGLAGSEIDDQGRVISGRTQAFSSPAIVPDDYAEPVGALSRVQACGSKPLQVVSSRM